MSDALTADILDILIREEGLRLTVYDDATGKPIVPGTKVIGHPTIGIGRCLDTKGITTFEARYFLANDVEETVQALSRQPWWAGLDDARRAVLVCMGFQMGVAGLLAFKTTLGHVAAGRFNAAADGMLASKWAQQTPGRAGRMAAIMRSGKL